MDVIERKAAIAALDGTVTISGTDNAKEVRRYVDLVKDRLERLPSQRRHSYCRECRASEVRDGAIYCNTFHSYVAVADMREEQE